MILERRRLITAILPAIFLCASVTAQILNSERIERTFGSYGIDVVYSDDSIRISNLYSIHDGRRIMRTLAVVGYPDRIDQAFAGEHRIILDGGSIGATFKQAGWEVVKTDHAYFRTELPVAAAQAMDRPAAGMISAHAYQLAIVRGPEEFRYALIIEMHHPDYLRVEDLREIYGPEEVEGLPESTRSLLAHGREILRRFGSTLSE